MLTVTKIALLVFSLGAVGLGATYLIQHYTVVKVSAPPVVIIDYRDKPPTEAELRERYGSAKDLKHPAF